MDAPSHWQEPPAGEAHMQYPPTMYARSQPPMAQMASSSASRKRSFPDAYEEASIKHKYLKVVHAGDNQPVEPLQQLQVPLVDTAPLDQPTPEVTNANQDPDFDADLFADHTEYLEDSTLDEENDDAELETNESDDTPRAPFQYTDMPVYSSLLEARVADPEYQAHKPSKRAIPRDEDCPAYVGRLVASMIYVRRAYRARAKAGEKRNLLLDGVYSKEHLVRKAWETLEDARDYYRNGCRNSKYGNRAYDRGTQKYLDKYDVDFKTLWLSICHACKVNKKIVDDLLMDQSNSLWQVITAPATIVKTKAGYQRGNNKRAEQTVKLLKKVKKYELEKKTKTDPGSEGPNDNSARTPAGSTRTATQAQKMQRDVTEARPQSRQPAETYRHAPTQPAPAQVESASSRGSPMGSADSGSSAPQHTKAALSDDTSPSSLSSNDHPDHLPTSLDRGSVANTPLSEHNGHPATQPGDELGEKAAPPRHQDHPRVAEQVSAMPLEMPDTVDINHAAPQTPLDAPSASTPALQPGVGGAPNNVQPNPVAHDASPTPDNDADLDLAFQYDFTYWWKHLESANAGPIIYLPDGSTVGQWWRDENGALRFIRYQVPAPLVTP